MAHCCNGSASAEGGGNLASIAKPNPDLVFGYSEDTFEDNQHMALDLLVAQFNKDYAMPDAGLRFHFFCCRIQGTSNRWHPFHCHKSSCKRWRSCHVSTVQLARRVSAERNVDFDEPQCFSISIYHAMACINVRWVSRDAKNGAFRFHLKHLLSYVLNIDGLKAVDRAIRNILSYGANERLVRICGELDLQAKKIEEMAIIGRDNLASDSLPEKQQQQRRPRKRNNVESLANGRQAPRIKRARRAQKIITYDQDEQDEEEDDEEGTTPSASGQLQISTEEDNRLNVRKKSDAKPNMKEVDLAPPHPKTVRPSRKLLAVKVPNKDS